MEKSEQKRDGSSLIVPESLLPTENVTTEQTLKDIYRIAQEDRNRALDAYSKLDSIIDNSSKVTPGMMEALNGAQHLIQTSTDKLIQIAKLKNSKDNVKTLNQFNLNFDDSVLDDEKESFEDRKAKYDVSRKPKK